MRPFKGIWGSFEFIDETAAVIEALREEGRDYSVMSPCPRHELHQAMGEPQSPIPFITLVMGGLGIFFGYALPSWTALDWVLPVSGKPIVGIPAFTIFGFELMVLLGGVFTAVGILALGYFNLFRKRLPSSATFKNYGRFSDDRYGVAVRCEESEAEKLEKLMRDHSVEEVVREF